MLFSVLIKFSLRTNYYIGMVQYKIMNCVIYNFVDHVVVSKLKDCPQHLLQQYFQLISHYEDEDIQP